ncbi:4-(cytidine 5'-diphospho)-2-C-methyl-D-erythritol kinase [Candidatus Woesearchaeota archaeon]|nr:4-(cytidine 5'-diphospho)-2-C-methyl-D-erythritol kinase [Candidatus Woesearchaeota archaeon]
MKIKAYAKLNLALDVLSRREGGFHEINSVMQQISLHDEISVEKGDKITLIGGLKDDIILKAALKLKGLFGIEEGAKISLKKNIPLSAGLAGGSADAAAALKALNELWNLNLSESSLIKIGSELGSDVPFCIAGKSCFVSGKGEKLERVDMPEMDIVVVNPGYGISTKDAYMELDSKDYEKTFSSLRLRSLNGTEKIASMLHNDFIHIQKPEVKGLIEEMVSKGAINASITGKGPTVFGIFENSKKALEAYRHFKARCPSAYVGMTIR